MTTIDGSASSTIRVFEFLQNKYPENCIVFSRGRTHKDVSMRWVQNADEPSEGYISTPATFWDQLRTHISRCTRLGNRLVVFPFGFSCADTNGHANVCIYDTITHTLQRFDPEGGLKKSMCVNDNVDDVLLNLFDAHMGKGFVRKYIAPNESMALQHRQERERLPREPDDPKYGFCSAWICFYADWRLSHPLMTPTEATTTAASFALAHSSSLTEFIREYARSI